MIELDVKHKVVIDFAKHNYIEVEITKGSENSTVLELYLTNQGQEIPMEDIAIVTVTATTPSEGKIFKELSVEGKYVLYPISNGIQNEAGKTVCELQATGWNGVTVNSFEFYINVKQNIFDDSMLVTADDITAVKTCVVRAEKAAVASEEVEQNIKEKEQQLLEDTQIAKNTKEEFEIYVKNLQEEIKKGKFIGAPGIQGPPGEPGKEGKQGPQGKQGNTGESGVVTPTSGFFTLSVDADGNVYASYPDEENPPEFEIDDDGNVYLITGEDNKVLIGNVKMTEEDVTKLIEVEVQEYMKEKKSDIENYCKSYINTEILGGAS